MVASRQRPVGYDNVDVGRRRPRHLVCNTPRADRTTADLTFLLILPIGLATEAEADLRQGRWPGGINQYLARTSRRHARVVGGCIGTAVPRRAPGST